jgi:hypothetical protein
MEVVLRIDANPSRSTWMTSVALMATFAVVLIVFRDSWSGLARVWSTSATFGHGILVPPIAAWLEWRSRRRLNE